MLSIAKLQNLKAIHNFLGLAFKSKFVVINRKTTKFKSNSQRLTGLEKRDCVVINCKSTKFESNSQQITVNLPIFYSCYQSQNYKIWKQFTTKLSVGSLESPLLSITKLQNLKAIHNYMRPNMFLKIVVINRKTTKFESNSQQSRTF